MNGDRKATAKEVKREIATVAGELHIAADALTARGIKEPAAAIREMARVGEGGDPRECSAEFAMKLERMNPFGRALALGGIYDVAKVVGERDERRGMAVSFLADLLLECETLYPQEMERAIYTHATSGGASN